MGTRENERRSVLGWHTNVGDLADGLGDRSNVVLVGSAAATDDVGEARLGELLLDARRT